MGKLIPILSSILVLGFVSTASASGITECGNYGFSGPWTSRTVLGGGLVVNLTTRTVRCSYARPFSLHVTPKRAHRYQGLSCRWRDFYESYDVRCTKGRQAIHWQGGV
jgi:hypothetical protein